MSPHKLGGWLRTQALILARNNATPVDFWLSQTPAELRDWIGVNNELTKKPEKGRK